MTNRRNSAHKSNPKMSARMLVLEWLDFGLTFEHMREHIAIQANTGNMTHTRRNEIIVAIFDEEMAQYPPDSDPIAAINED